MAGSVDFAELVRRIAASSVAFVSLDSFSVGPKIFASKIIPTHQISWHPD
jgi:hypothetical protein